MVPRNLADADLARMNEIPVDWGIEIGVLAEVFRNCSTRRICQVDLCQKYEHRHRPLSPGDPSTGMFKMAIDIARTLFSTLAAEGVVLTEKFFKTLKVTYLRAGNVAIDKYNDEPLSTAFPLIGIRRVSPLRPFSRQSILQARAFSAIPLGANSSPVGGESHRHCGIFSRGCGRPLKRITVRRILHT